MFHIRFSCEEDYLHQHELYEMLRSRNLYQVQFDLKKRLEKRIRSIELAEKMHEATSQSKKTMFLHTVQERIKKRNRFGEKYKRNFSLGDLPDQPDIPTKPLHKRLPRHRSEEPTDTSEKDVKRSQTAPEMGVLQKSQDIEGHTEEDIVSLRRNVTFCGKSFPMAKSAKRRARNQNLQSVEENGGGTRLPAAIAANENRIDHSLHLPEINQENSKAEETRKKGTLSPTVLATVKNMSMFESGVTAPNGRLILSKQDYDDFIDQYRQAQKNWLQKQRRKSESLEEKVKNFRIENEELS